VTSLAVGALLCAIAGTAQAGMFIPEDSVMSYRMSGMAESVIPALPGSESQVSLVDNGMGAMTSC
jgi:hypothetical protein